MDSIETNENKGQGNQAFGPGIKEFPFVPARFYYLLLVLPVVFCICWVYCFYKSKTFFSTYPDSIYIYLVNATSIASGNLDIGHYDNPGTPVHILGSVIVYIVHLFAGNRLVYEDVLADPEFYLRFCAGTFGLFLLGSVYFAARFVLKHTGNFLLAVFFQLLPICSYFTIHYLLLVRMCPEDLIIAVLISYYAFLWVLCYKRDAFPDSAFSRKSHIFLFSFVSALLVTTKMTSMPFLIVPFFFLKKFSQKAAYVFVTFVMAAFMIYPIWPKLPEMYDWFTRLATHSGAYGQGQAGVSSTTLLSNLVKLFEYDLFFTIGYFLLSLTLIVGFIKKMRRENFYKLIFAFWIICSMQLMLACKQFGYHYLIAAQLLIIPGLLAAHQLFKATALPTKPGYVLFGLCFVLFGFKTATQINYYRGGNKMYISGLDAKKYSGVPKIITTGYQGSCFVESAIRFGASYGGRYYHSSNYFLRKEYPNSYFYDMQLPENIIKQFDIQLSPAQFFEAKPRVLVYFVQMSREDERVVLNKITAGLEPVIKSIREEAYNEATGERFYIIETDTAKARPKYSGFVQLDYDFEKQNQQHTSFAPATGTIFIGETTAASSDQFYSGTHSIKIAAGQYSCCTTFDVNPGDAFDISVKSFAPERPVGITLSGQTFGFFDHNSEAIVADNGKGWKTISLKAVVPADFQQKKINFCLYYFGFKTAYADDLQIKILRSTAATPEETAPPGLKEIQKFILKAEGGNYLALGTDNYLYANQPDASKATVFEKVELGNGLVSFKASNGMFVSADQNVQSRLIANRKEAQGWESFTIGGNSLSSVHIKAQAGTFVCADHGKGEELIADKTKASTWETFELIKKQ